MTTPYDHGHYNMTICRSTRSAAPHGCYTTFHAPGHASAAGTARYRDRFPNLRDAGHFRQAEQVPGVSQLWLSSIGLGTYLGEPSDAADQATCRSD